MAIFQIEKQIELDAGHRVPYHNSKCRHIHGHRYKVIAQLMGRSLVPAPSERSDSEMLVDFGFIKQGLMEVVHDPFDHRLILWNKDSLIQSAEQALVLIESVTPVPMIPTAEGLAEYWYNGLVLYFQEHSDPMWQSMLLRLRQLTVWETPTSKATYSPGGQGQFKYYPSL